MYYLLPCIRKTNYYCDISMVEADLQIVSLGKVCVCVCVCVCASSLTLCPDSLHMQDLQTLESTLSLSLEKRAVQ